MNTLFLILRFSISILESNKYDIMIKHYNDLQYLNIDNYLDKDL